MDFVNLFIHYEFVKTVWIFRVFYPKDDPILNCPNAKYQCLICLVQKGIVKKFTVKENLKRNDIWNFYSAKSN